VIARADVVVTTRLHGLVLALTQGMPVLAVDPVAGGAKVATQAAAWGWPVLLPRSGSRCWTTLEELAKEAAS
jgi:Polysaccharide pyruvyl transferase